ncbi:type II toxin-antitoxin system VapC family toxin [Pelagibacterium sediminicola]|uniref:type II toxin-antitoxin system VapC family toxin n=1 Tax=Pelagibacterium sediminicola TaxID=2248761 RepID=UPI000E315789|nr:type II toxin-antitoxin system VapC family toxin [Pelagibacterium sediminicola]
MFVDACAIIAILSDEVEAERVSAALATATKRLTSPVAVLETVIALARPDKFNLPVNAVEPIVLEFLDERGIDIIDLPPAREATRLVLSAAHRYRSGKNRLNLGDCLHYACAKYYGLPILATSDEFGSTDLETVPREPWIV